ncbi:MAG: acetylxylan esterase [Armatimonadetes bacterium]|nr:acetylxylan esterase [Armatimonadota bacterium]
MADDQFADALKLTRRDLLKAAAVGMAGAAWGGLQSDPATGSSAAQGGKGTAMARPEIVQNPIQASVDLRDMLRRHIVERSLACMEEAARYRSRCLEDGRTEEYRRKIRAAVRGFYGEMPVGENGPPVRAVEVSRHAGEGFRLENFLFDSFPGWQVNASVFVPLDYAPPYPAVVIPVGHSGKQFEDYQLPAQLFARCGFLAVLFDPPGQSGERQPGNDHFADGVRSYLVGESSSRYFVADALRCIDYLASRSDTDLSRGVAMTGVSGGGATTTLAALLDDRIAVSGPSCCLSPLSDLDITQCYAGCPETHPWRRYAEGVDEVDLLCAASPKPTLLMAGESDKVFRIEDTRRLAGEVKGFYQAARAPERFEFYPDRAGHCYSLRQARRFARFMNLWLLDHPDRPLPDLPDSAFRMLPYEELRCRPCLDVHIRSLTLDRAVGLAESRSRSRLQEAARAVAGAKEETPAPEAVAGRPFRVWTHFWQQLLLKPEQGIEMPATFLYAEKSPAATLLHFDDAGRNRLLYRNGPLATAARFIDRERQGFNIFAVDVRGWGDSAPAMYPYELAGWGSIDRCLAYMSAALGDPIMSMRIRDGLAALACLRSRPEAAGKPIAVSGCGLGGLVALHVAAIDGKVDACVLWDSLVSFQALLEAENYVWPADAFLPQALLHYDLPELAASLPLRVKILRPLDGTGNPLSAPEIDDLSRRASQSIYEAESGDVGTFLEKLLAGM